jgi:hypothetical protein
VILAFIVGASPDVVGDGVSALVKSLSRRKGHQDSIFAMGAFGKFHRKTLLMIEKFALIKRNL